MYKNKKMDSMYGNKIVLEKNEGWFVGVEYNALFHIDFESSECQLLTLLPAENIYRKDAYFGCDKIEQYIYIYPRQMNGNILITSLDGRVVKEIELENFEQKEVGIVDTYVYKDKIYVMSLGLRKVIVLDSKKNVIVDSYAIYEDVKNIRNKGRLLFKEGVIFITIRDSNKIYMLNLETKQMGQCEIDGMVNGIVSFGNAGRDIWLTSKEKVIYFWNKFENRIRKIENLPEKFGRYKLDSYNQLFLDVDTKFDEKGFYLEGVCIEQCIWFVPYFYNMILCVDIASLEVREICIPNEAEDECTWRKNRRKAKFWLEYVREERYIGIYSFKNNYIIEIDTKSFKIEIKEFYVSNKDICLIMSEKTKKGNLVETESLNLQNYITNLEMFKKNTKKTKNIGNKIYGELLE